MTINQDTIQKIKHLINNFFRTPPKKISRLNTFRQQNRDLRNDSLKRAQFFKIDKTVKIIKNLAKLAKMEKIT